MKASNSFEGKSVALLYYVFAFILLWEWLKPLNAFTDTGNTFIFVFFIGVSFLMTFFHTKWYISFPVKIFIIMFMLHGLYFEGVFFSFLWISDLMRDIGFNFSLIPSADWMGMTSSFRTLLFFILLWLLVYLIHYWILYQKRILFFFVLTLVYITVLDTFTPYDATYAIVRIVLIGFFMLGLLYFDRLKKLENLKVKRITSLRWIMPLFAFIVFSMILAILAPKASPQWPDPVPFITAVGQQDEGGGDTKRIGYSPNDESLGGSFVSDDTEVFRHTSTDRHYWRVETKDVYTGKGWQASDPEAVQEEISSIPDELSWFDDRVETKSLESSITINQEYRYLHVIYPLGLTSVKTESELPLFLNRNSEMISPFQDNEGSREDFLSYDVTYDLPLYPLNEMKKAQTFEDVPEGFNERYTQLPESLPERVRELAVSITESKDNQFDKAKAIEDYLGSAEYTYDKEEIPVPSAEQDYVDQFLFETFKGYCDNFSTSMIVLLRSVNIPARWVKGYTEGEFVSTAENSEREYVVTNNNAHSWVEIYFDGVGWVPFEPTKGFVNPYTLTNDYRDVTENEDKEEPEEVLEEEKDPEQTPEKPEEVEEEETASSTNNSGLNMGDLRLGSIGLYTLLIVGALLIFIVYRTRMKWLPGLIIMKYKNRSDDDVFFQAYESLLKQYERRGIKRKEGQTLREYARYIDEYFQMVHMTALTKNYEKALYRQDNAKDEWRKSVELWENLIKRTSS
ncbi:transglutaminase TgpA family protein [Metabacillus halosaccharovorans]|uniref:transglutaminase TgpA family protein n=1 Tax=Metabacillus halosaccharovorans TaxID=930124 RepID=UPI00203D3712|nr:transglutaminaseTgpA domain-containing protein [Metabacillus halosaccharovorans]MCM3444711.1 transglutaminaseTgpA domain-containing protein [Metabacillus halosaccharovorans]